MQYFSNGVKIYITFKYHLEKGLWITLFLQTEKCHIYAYFVPKLSPCFQHTALVLLCFEEPLDVL